MKATRLLLKTPFYLFFTTGVCLYLFVAMSGFVTWKQDFLDSGTSSMGSLVAGFFVLMMFYPGIVPLVASFYFFVFSKSIYTKLAGLAVISFLIVAHILVSVMALHSSVYISLLIYCIEGCVVFAGIRFFNTRP